MNVFENDNVKLFTEAILSLETEEECRSFLSDIMTTKELLDISQRMMVAKLLDNGLVYSRIMELSGASSATISRVNRCYEYGADGYKTVLNKLKKD